MGAEYVTRVIRARNKDDLRVKFNQMQDECRFENGHSYSGGIGMADGLEILTPKGFIFLSRNEASKAAETQAEKWGPAIAAPFISQDGTHCYLIFAICSS